MRNAVLFIIILLLTVSAHLKAAEPEIAIQSGIFLEKSKQADLNDFALPTAKKGKSLVFVGDVMLARNVESLMNKNGYSYPYSFLPQLSSSTLLIGNFEASIPQKHIHTPDFTYSFSVAKENISALHTYGFSLLNVANNHSFDFATSGLEHTISTIQSNDMMTFGHPNIVSTSTSVKKVYLDDISIAIIGVNLVNIPYSLSDITAVIQAVAKDTNVQLVYIHWGDEYKIYHSKEQERLAHTMVEAGADIIIGHHPHVVQDIEKYKQGVIFYSLGNFIFDQYFSKRVQEGLLLKMTRKSKGIAVNLHGVTSVQTPSAPRYMSKNENKQFLRQIAQGSSYKLKEEISLGELFVPTGN